nr:hypothetical protein [Streptomyces sp. SID4945]
MPPEFFLDRNLGRRVAEGLRAHGWTVHRIREFFPDDGQDVPDEVWITYGLERSWVPLSKDGRIKTRGRALLPGQPAVADHRHDRTARRAARRHPPGGRARRPGGLRGAPRPRGAHMALRGRRYGAGPASPSRGAPPRTRPSRTPWNAPGLSPCTPPVPS